MKRLLIGLVVGAFLVAPVYSDFDYSQFDNMEIEELETVNDKLEKIIAQKKYDSGEYPWRFDKYYENETYEIGDEWIVTGLWKFKIESVEETSSGIDTVDPKPDVMYLVTFSFENLGYTYKTDGLRFWLWSDASVTDSDGEIGTCISENGTDIPGTAIPDELPIGAHCSATEAVGLKHPGDFYLTVSKSGNELDEHVATFHLKVD